LYGLGSQSTFSSEGGIGWVLWWYFSRLFPLILLVSEGILLLGKLNFQKPWNFGRILSQQVRSRRGGGIHPIYELFGQYLMNCCGAMGSRLYLNNWYCKSE
jgi:hypothetical protein